MDANLPLRKPPDRVVGSILGLAVGDALGAPFEFRRAHDVPEPVPAFELPWMGRPPGSTTDDTAMARNLWTSLTATDGELDPADVLRRHSRVVRHVAARRRHPHPSGAERMARRGHRRGQRLRCRGVVRR